MTRNSAGGTTWPPTAASILPADAESAVLVGRVHVGAVDGPSVVTIRDGLVVDLSAHFATMSMLTELPDPASAVCSVSGPVLGSLDDALLGALEPAAHSPIALLSPIDLQAVKAAGVTFVVSMLERVIEERSAGDPARAELFRGEIRELIGRDLSNVRPGSPEAMQVKRALLASGDWSQYLEVGLGVDAEIFTKTSPLATVGGAADIGIHPRSEWNNPEPEVVLAVSSTGDVVGATLGNDVNLRDFEGRSALLLSKAKDNNASAAVGPFIRLFDDDFGLDDVRRLTLRLRVSGQDGFVLEGESSMSMISRDPTDLVGQLIGATHQYPDGAVLYLGTMFAPTQDRGASGAGFTHHVDDVVEITTPQLGSLVNRVRTSDACPPWTYGLTALMTNLA